MSEIKNSDMRQKILLYSDALLLAEAVWGLSLIWEQLEKHKSHGTGLSLQTAGKINQLASATYDHNVYDHKFMAICFYPSHGLHSH